MTAILEQAVLLQSAKNDLPSDQYKLFLVEANISETTSKKLMQIAKKASLLMLHQDVLLTNWTTVYQVAKLDNDKINSLVASGSLNSHMTARDLNNALGLTRATTITVKSNVEPNSQTVTVNFASLPSSAKPQFAKFLRWASKNIPAENLASAIVWSSEFQMELQQLTQAISDVHSAKKRPNKRFDA